MSIPVTIGGNGIGVVGDGTSTGGSTTGSGTSTGTTPVGGGTTSGEDGIGSGTQVIPVIDVPVTIGGNGIGVVGDGTSTGGSTTGSGTSTGTTPVGGGHDLRRGRRRFRHAGHPGDRRPGHDRWERHRCDR
ncbi:hypothetical protein [Curtobacterium sp. MCPF17_052]|uniref:hypothetical protein n=1 Tax=Curtobacterium sp. MCPF17_052 TaxID=2175655 RepID=UPI0024E02554|nr:hypothetical protein [Curtobacterium sp. MCPF17_052]WIB13142.1 hypothetical protein DEJ36_04310 [Curtobacterium sp. MCPF17_052]